MTPLGGFQPRYGCARRSYFGQLCDHQSVARHQPLSPSRERGWGEGEPGAHLGAAALPVIGLAAASDEATVLRPTQSRSRPLPQKPGPPPTLWEPPWRRSGFRRASNSGDATVFRATSNRGQDRSHKSQARRQLCGSRLGGDRGIRHAGASGEATVLRPTQSRSSRSHKSQARRRLCGSRLGGDRDSDAPVIRATPLCSEQPPIAVKSAPTKARPAAQPGGGFAHHCARSRYHRVPPPLLRPA